MSKSKIDIEEIFNQGSIDYYTSTEGIESLEKINKELENIDEEEYLV